MCVCRARDRAEHRSAGAIVCDQQEEQSYTPTCPWSRHLPLPIPGWLSRLGYKFTKLSVLVIYSLFIKKKVYLLSSRRKALNTPNKVWVYCREIK